MPDHIHLFVQLHPTIALSNFMRKLKNATHIWIDQNRQDFPDYESWASKYCGLTYAYKDKKVIVNYIKNQRKHHAKESTTDEVRRLLKEEEIEIDERFFEEY